MNQKDISNSRTFKYLGTKISYDQPNAGDDEVNHRKLQANIAFNKHRKVLKNYRILLPTRVQLLDSLVRSKLTYNCQTWPLTEKQTNTMNAQYVRYLRELVRNGTARKENSYSLKMTNKQILHITKRENLSVFMSRIQEKFIATIIRAPNFCQNKKLIFNEDKTTKKGRKGPNIFKQILHQRQQTEQDFCTEAIIKLI